MSMLCSCFVQLLFRGASLSLAMNCAIGWGLSGQVLRAEKPVSEPTPVRFNQEIRPIFTKHCTACHGGVKQAGDLSFVYGEKALTVVEPGDAEASYLLERVTAESDEERMPPPEHGPRLSSDEIDLLTRWINQGAKWESHWAYQKPERAEQPNVQLTTWPRQPVDWLVLKRQEDRQVTPAAEEIPLRWLRRAAFDLTGLPPSMELREQFLKTLDSRSADAYEQAVDELLASPHFGERWASVWLDQVRYADSMGLGLDGYRSIWKYRDWVIDAFNEDMPYDDFTIKQIAGDLQPGATIEDHIATAVHRLTQTNEEGGTDDEEFRIGAVLDRVSTTWQAWHGTTFGCVQCHAHPYDAFEHNEFYKFAAFFNNTADSDLDEDWPVMKVPVDERHYDDASSLLAQMHSQRRALWEKQYQTAIESPDWKSLRLETAHSSTATPIKIERKEKHDEFHTAGTLVRDTDITLTAKMPEAMKSLTAIRFTALPLDPEKALTDSEWGFVLSQVEAYLTSPDIGGPIPLEIAKVIGDEPFPHHDPDDSLDGKSKFGFSAYSRINHPRTSALVLSAPVELPPGTTLHMTLKHRVWILASFALVTRRGHLAVTDDQEIMQVVNGQEFLEAEQALAAVTSKSKKFNSVTVPVLRELDSRFSRPSHVFIRGLFLTKGDEVQSDVPESLHPYECDEGGTRLDLARWMASPENPLVARVAVNRVWAQLFGRGLVVTEEDFGSSGELPSHPELLDDLAVRFQTDYGWRHKPLLRELVLSSTYRQSSRMRPDINDDANELLARGPRQALSAEMVRDQALAVSGLLTAQLHGPPRYPPLPEGVWQPFKASDKWETPPMGDPQRYRRAIYTYVKRSVQFPLFGTFDAPTREFCSPRRLRSNTPLQSLMTLNSESFQECAQGLAERMREAGERVDDQIAYGFVLVTSREASVEERQKLRVSYDRMASASNSEIGLTSLASILLNLDEVMTR